MVKKVKASSTGSDTTRKSTEKTKVEETVSNPTNEGKEVKDEIAE